MTYHLLLGPCSVRRFKFLKLCELVLRKKFIIEVFGHVHGILVLNRDFRFVEVVEVIESGFEVVFQVLEHLRGGYGPGVAERNGHDVVHPARVIVVAGMRHMGLRREMQHFGRGSGPCTGHYGAQQYTGE